jgi:GWxTD domain-containing protein
VNTIKANSNRDSGYFIAERTAKSILVAIILLSLSIFLWGCAGAYRPGQGPAERKIGTPVFNYEVISLLSENINNTDLMIIVQIPYDNLQFIQENEVFKAQYEVTVAISDASGTIVADRFSTYSVEEPNYYKTNARSIFANAKILIPVSSAKYKILVEVTDLESKERSQVTVSKDLQSETSNCRLSDLILIKPIPNSTDPRDFDPLASLFINKGETDVYLYYESTFSGTTPLITSWKLIELPNDTIKVETDTITTGEKLIQNRIPLELSSLLPGQYSITLEIASGECHQVTNKQFIIQYQDLPPSITNLDDAIEELKYIATPEEIDSMRRAFHSAKEEMFRKFWKQRDPTPGTPENEQMDEYYRRIDYANTHFSTQRPGWMTDRGYIYVKYGEPSDIVRELIPRNQKPYEIWTYNELGLQFYFVDRTGFGDYELVSPINEW